MREQVPFRDPHAGPGSMSTMSAQESPLWGRASSISAAAQAAVRCAVAYLIRFNFDWNRDVSRFARRWSLADGTELLPPGKAKPSPRGFRWRSGCDGPWNRIGISDPGNIFLRDCDRARRDHEERLKGAAGYRGRTAYARGRPTGIQVDRGR